jgi:hypothetical protein
MTKRSGDEETEDISRAINVRVVAWARTRGIDPTLLVRMIPDEDQYMVDGLPWTIPFSEWIRAKWDEWWKLCPSPYSKTCAHCYNHEAFNAWLQEK